MMSLRNDNRKKVRTLIVLMLFGCVFLERAVLAYGDTETEKIEIFKDSAGREVIRITGQESAETAAGRAANPKNSRGTNVGGAGNSILISRASVKVLNLKKSAAPNSFETFESDHFTIEMQGNDNLGVESLEILEPFYQLLLTGLPELGKLPFKKESLKIKVLRTKEDYDRFCEVTGGCPQSAGVTETRYHRFEAGAKYGSFRVNQIYLYWDRGEEDYYRVLFHEATHQLVHVHLQKMIPRWLSEGLATYFESARFNHKEIYLPKPFVNHFGASMNQYLSHDGSPFAIFSWDKSGPAEPAYYGLSANFIAFMVENPSYRADLSRLIRKIYSAVPEANAFEQVFGPAFVTPFWKSWQAQLAAVSDGRT
jgi:hypothetical protein